ncbi:MAG: hypothetical protein A3G34_10580 [Candidatus Lindowbacteria bacterium RIFCSPLOWO2_12_FULL_62_27]|nr:MAG: hypothetical protein A3G34_10580 [Candidatus Lindowbacteria bacterium RIFCSPLOWO2_12_FULL_62_27]
MISDTVGQIQEFPIMAFDAQPDRQVFVVGRNIKIAGLFIDGRLEESVHDFDGIRFGLVGPR